MGQTPAHPVCLWKQFDSVSAAWQGALNFLIDVELADTHPTPPPVQVDSASQIETIREAGCTGIGGTLIAQRSHAGGEGSTRSGPQGGGGLAPSRNRIRYVFRVVRRYGATKNGPGRG